MHSLAELLGEGRDDCSLHLELVSEQHEHEG